MEVNYNMMKYLPYYHFKDKGEDNRKHNNNYSKMKMYAIFGVYMIIIKTKFVI